MNAYDREVMEAEMEEEANANRRFKAAQIRRAFKKHSQQLEKEMNQSIPAGIRWSGRVSI